MTDLFPWLPLAVPIELGLTVGRLLHAGNDFQLLLSGNGENIFLFLRKAFNSTADTGSAKAVQSLIQNGVLRNFSYSDEEFVYGIFSREEAPKKISSLVGSPGNSSSVA